MYSKYILKDLQNSYNEWNEYIINLFQEYFENVKSYRNIKLCTQMYS